MSTTPEKPMEPSKWALERAEKYYQAPENIRELALEFDAIARERDEAAEELAHTVEKYYPTIAGRVIQLRGAGEDNAAAKWSEITTAFRSALAEFRKGKGSGSSE